MTAWVFGSLLLVPACDREAADSGENPEVQENSAQEQGSEKAAEPKEGSKQASPEKSLTPEASPNPDGETGGSTGEGSTTGDTLEPSGEDSSTEESESTGESGEQKIDCSSLKVSGNQLGQVPKNLTLLAANGDQVSLHDYCNEVVFLMTGTAG